MKTRNLKLLCLLLETVGIVALFLPFVWGYSPWKVLAESVQDPRSGAAEFWPFALPTFLTPFVWLQTLRSLFHRSLTRAELWLCAALVVLLMLVPLGFWLLKFLATGGWTLPSLALLFGPAPFAAGLLMTLKRKGVASQFLAPLSLRCAYIPNAVFCLVAFSEWGHDWKDLQVGAACVAATVILYLAEIVYLTRRGLKARPAVVPKTI
ncbi:MAG: hypothetical protein ABSG50_03705 [Opitutaceae bacterium]|jgi:hypothetical protein